MQCVGSYLVGSRQHPTVRQRLLVVVCLFGSLEPVVLEVGQVEDSDVRGNGHKEVIVSDGNDTGVVLQNEADDVAVLTCMF